MTVLAALVETAVFAARAPRLRLEFAMVKVAKGRLGAGADVLIGMDIISQGDFSITNQNGKTVFSFRIPSAHTVDFVKQHNEAALREHISRSGKGSFRNKKK